LDSHGGHPGSGVVTYAAFHHPVGETRIVELDHRGDAVVIEIAILTNLHARSQ